MPRRQCCHEGCRKRPAYDVELEGQSSKPESYSNHASPPGMTNVSTKTAVPGHTLLLVEVHHICATFRAECALLGPHQTVARVLAAGRVLEALVHNIHHSLRRNDECLHQEGGAAPGTRRLGYLHIVNKSYGRAPQLRATTRSRFGGNPEKRKFCA